MTKKSLAGLDDSTHPVDLSVDDVLQLSRGPQNLLVARFKIRLLRGPHFAHRVEKFSCIHFVLFCSICFLCDS